MTEASNSSIDDTSSTVGARAHARAQGGTRIDEMATIPARDLDPLPEGVVRETLVWAETLPGGSYASRRLARGTSLRLTDRDGDACAHLILYNAHQSQERLCVADTVKVMWNAYLGVGHLLLSDQARVLATIVGDSSNRHDTMTGVSTLARNIARYGQGAPESDSPAGRELFKLAAAKEGLSVRDIAPSISFFQGVRVEEEGALSFLGSCGADASVEILAEMDLIVLLVNTAHPMDPRPAYVNTPLQVIATRGAGTNESDPRFSATPEGRRAYLNTFGYLAAMQGGAL